MPRRITRKPAASKLPKPVDPARRKLLMGAAFGIGAAAVVGGGGVLSYFVANERTRSHFEEEILGILKSGPRTLREGSPILTIHGKTYYWEKDSLRIPAYAAEALKDATQVYWVEAIRNEDGTGRLIVQTFPKKALPCPRVRFLPGWNPLSSEPTLPPLIYETDGVSSNQPGVEQGKTCAFGRGLIILDRRGIESLAVELMAPFRPDSFSPPLESEQSVLGLAANQLSEQVQALSRKQTFSLEEVMYDHILIHETGHWLGRNFLQPEAQVLSANLLRPSTLRELSSSFGQLDEVSADFVYLQHLLSEPNAEKRRAMAIVMIIDAIKTDWAPETPIEGLLYRHSYSVAGALLTSCSYYTAKGELDFDFERAQVLLERVSRYIHDYQQRFIENEFWPAAMKRLDLTNESDLAATAQNRIREICDQQGVAQWEGAYLFWREILEGLPRENQLAIWRKAYQVDSAGVQRELAKILDLPTTSDRAFRTDLAERLTQKKR